ncbi:MAG TPA: hypothetical protein VMZ52_20655 [Bryobacteraceae bacterium]|nr:hypothetical protein [Bryobacteraceae bacterium]
MTVAAASPADAYRPLGPEHNLASVLSHAEPHVTSDYTFQFAGKLYQIARSNILPGLRGSSVRVERRLDGSIAVRYRDKHLAVSQCQPRPKAAVIARPKPATAPKSTAAERTAAWRRAGHDLFKPGPKLWAAVADRTRTRDTLD